MTDDDIRLIPVDDSDIGPEMRMLIEQRLSQRSEIQPEQCLHMGVRQLGTSRLDKLTPAWCPQCWRIFPDGKVLPYDQRVEGQTYAIIMPPYVIEDLMRLRQDRD